MMMIREWNIFSERSRAVHTGKCVGYTPRHGPLTLAAPWFGSVETMNLKEWFNETTQSIDLPKRYRLE